MSDKEIQDLQNQLDQIQAKLNEATNKEECIVPLDECKLIKDNQLTFGGHEVIIKSKDHIECKDVSGRLDHLLTIKYFIDAQNRNILGFGNILGNGAILDIPKFDKNAIKIGCTTGTYDELCKIIEAAEKL